MGYLSLKQTGSQKRGSVGTVRLHIFSRIIYVPVCTCLNVLHAWFGLGLTLYAVVVISTPNLHIREAMVTEILVGSNDDVIGVRTFFGVNFIAPSVVLTTGTFMNGKIWVGRSSMSAGRAGESASEGLTENLQTLGFETDRLKTGTPARVDIRSVDYSKLEAQPGDEEVSWIMIN